MAMEPIHILFVEDDAAEQASIERFVRNLALRYDLDLVKSADEALKRLEKKAYDIAIIDYRFSDGTAFDLLRKLGDTPAVFLTASGQEEIAAMVLERGAYDYLFKDPGKNYLMLLPATIQKVLARRGAEEALRQSEARCRDLLETVLGIYLCVSEEGHVLLANRSGAMQLGYTVSELIGMPLTKLVQPGDVEKLKDVLLAAAAEPGKVRPFEFRATRKDGGVLEVAADVRAQPRMGRQVPVIRMLCRDITAEKKARAPAHPPAAETRAPVAAAAPPPVPQTSAVVDTYHGTERLLVVDDEPEQRAVAARMLAKLGYQVVTAESGHAAVELMKQADLTESTADRSPFDLVLLDMTMQQGFDGLDTYRQMADLFPGQKCIIVSGWCEDERVKQAQSLGAGQFVGKPYTFKDIGKAVRGELDRRP